MKVEFKGGRQFEAALRELDISRGRKRGIARRSLLGAADDIREEWARRAPDDPATGAGRFLRDSIKVAPRRSRNPDQVSVAVGIDKSVDPPTDKPRQGGGTYRDPGVAGVAVMLEFGTPDIPANPSGRMAWETKKMDALQRISADLKAEIEKTAAREARKAARAK